MLCQAYTEPQFLEREQQESQGLGIALLRPGHEARISPTAPSPAQHRNEGALQQIHGGRTSWGSGSIAGDPKPGLGLPLKLRLL